MNENILVGIVIEIACHYNYLKGLERYGVSTKAQRRWVEEEINYWQIWHMNL